MGINEKCWLLFSAGHAAKLIQLIDSLHFLLSDNLGLVSLLGGHFHGSSLLNSSCPSWRTTEIKGAEKPGLVTKNGLVFFW